MKVGDKVIVDPRLHGCIWCIPVEEVKGKIMTIISINNPRGFEAYCTVIDCMAVAYAIDESLIETFEGRAGIETKDGLTLGNTVVDYRYHHVWEDLPKVKIARTARKRGSL